MDREKERIRERSSQDQDDRILLLEKGRRGILNVVFGRTMLILLMLAVQITLMVLAFRSVQTFMPYLYGVQMALYAVLLLHLVNKPSEATTKVTWILLVVLLPALGVALYLFVEMDIGHRVLNRRLTQLLRALWWPALHPQADRSQPCRSSPVSPDFWREGVPL